MVQLEKKRLSLFLQPNTLNNFLGGGFIRRFTYPINLQTITPANYAAAVASLGGPDLMTTRIFLGYTLITHLDLFI